MLGNLNHYQIFYYAAKYLSMTKTAKELYMTQSSVTRAISQLESEIGLELFIRSPKGLALTGDGKLFYDALEPVFTQLDIAEKQLNDLKSLAAGSIRIAVNNMAAELLLISVKEAYQEKYPGISISISNFSSAQIPDLLLENYFDLAFIYDSSKDQDMFSPALLEEKKLVKNLCGSYREACLAGSHFRSFAREKQTAETLSRLPLIYPLSVTEPYRYYFELLRPQGPTEEDYPVEGPTHRLKLAQMNRGITFFPEHFAKEALRTGKLYSIPVDFDTFPGSFYAVYSKKHPLNHTEEIFIDHVKGYAY